MPIIPPDLLNRLPLLSRTAVPPSTIEVSRGNAITLLKNGGELFPALVAAIDSATHDVCIETYIFCDDTAGELIANALKSAARRGVSVRVVVDGVGMGATSPLFLDALKQAGVELAIFRPEREFFSLRRSRLRRMHRKISLIDGRIGFVGGINLLDDMTDALSTTHPRYDYAVKIEGPLLADIYLAVNRLWRVLSRAKLQRKERQLNQSQPAHALYVPGNIAAAGTLNAKFLVRDNFRFRRAIEQEYLAAISAAQKNILMVSPYFLPGRAMRHALRDAAKRGVGVTLLLQGRADHPLMQLATRALYDQLLVAGVQLYEYGVSMLHGKVAVIDDEWATVGSSNLDPFSLLLNREANVIVLNSKFALELRDSVFAEIAANAGQMKVTDWQHRSRWARIQSWSAYGLAKFIAGWIGFKNEWRG